MENSTKPLTGLLSTSSSKFSSFKAFKFPRLPQLIVNTADDVPPPVPPKEPYYRFNNHSTNNIPSNMAKKPSASYPAPSRSTLSLASVNSAATQDTSAPRKSSKGKGSPVATFGKTLLRLARRGPKSSKEPEQDVQTKAPDGNISLPWNFSHNIHVDEALVGLPPSWTTSLAEAGFSEDEIDAIHSRRAHPYFDLRPLSPSATSPVTIITRPNPRTSSLPSQNAGSTTSLSSSSQSNHSNSRNASSPQTRTAPSTAPPSQPPASQWPYSDTATVTTTTNTSGGGTIATLTTPQTDPSLHRPQFSASTISTIDTLPLPPSQAHSSMYYTESMHANISHGHSHSPSYASALTPAPRPLPQSRLALITTNEMSSSPPPAYPSGLSPLASANGPNELAPSSSTGRTTQAPSHRPSRSQTATPIHHIPSSSMSSSTSATVNPHSTSNVSLSAVNSAPSTVESASTTANRKKLPVGAPPRLSFHGSGILDWAESLMSALPTNDPRRESGTLAEQQETAIAAATAAAPVTTATAAEQDGAVQELPNPWPSAEEETAKEKESGKESGPVKDKDSGAMPGESENEKASETGKDEKDVQRSMNMSSVSSLKIQQSPRKTPPQKLPPPLQVPPPPQLRAGGRAKKGANAAARLTPLWNEVMENASPIVEKTQMSEIEVNGELEGKSVVQEVSALASPLPLSGDSPRLTNAAREQKSLEVGHSNRDSGMSTLSMTSEATVTHAVVRSAAFVTRAVAEKVLVVGMESENREKVKGTVQDQEHERGRVDVRALTIRPTSRMSNHSSGSSGTGSACSSSFDLEHKTPLTDVEVDVDAVTSPNGKLTNGLHIRGEKVTEGKSKPTIVIEPAAPDEQPLPPPIASACVTPSPRYRGWVSKLLSPLKEFIDDKIDPRQHYVDLTEIAEGESGSVFAARVIDSDKLRLLQSSSPQLGAIATNAAVAIKNVPLLPSGSPKLGELKKELEVLKGLRHENVLMIDHLYVDTVEDSLWIRMELMEKSLADVVCLVEAGLMMHERMIARFANDLLLGLEYLQTHRIAHRDVRSDNLLINGVGVLKIADFSNAVQVPSGSPLCTEPAGVVYWQAPEVRSEAYDPLKVDVWSAGATVWEMAQNQPPFTGYTDARQIGNRWPPLSHPELYSRPFHEFLLLSSRPASTRPGPSELLTNSFVQNACGRQVIIQLLSQCRAIEQRMLEEATTPEGPLNHS